MSADHPASRLRPSMVELRRRANVTVIAFAAVLLARLADLVVREWSITLVQSIPAEGADSELMASLHEADGLVQAASIAGSITFFATAVVFLRWTHRLVALTHGLGGSLEWQPAQGVWAFFIPFISLIRPYQVLAAVHAALAPGKVVVPGPRVAPSAQSDYRSAAFSTPAAPRNLPAALVGPWWAAFMMMNLSAELSVVGGKPVGASGLISSYQGHMFASFMAVVAAALAVTVVRGLTARAEERFGRIRESTPEQLAEQGIVLP